jgi:hypothetical protein
MLGALFRLPPPLRRVSSLQADYPPPHCHKLRASYSRRQGLGGSGRPRKRAGTRGRTTRAPVCHPPFWKNAPPLLLMPPAFLITRRFHLFTSAPKGCSKAVKSVEAAHPFGQPLLLTTRRFRLQSKRNRHLSGSGTSFRTTTIVKYLNSLRLLES